MLPCSTTPPAVTAAPPWIMAQWFHLAEETIATRCACGNWFSHHAWPHFISIERLVVLVVKRVVVHRKEVWLIRARQSLIGSFKCLNFNEFCFLVNKEILQCSWSPRVPFNAFQILHHRFRLKKCQKPEMWAEAPKKTSLLQCKDTSITSGCMWSYPK